MNMRINFIAANEKRSFSVVTKSFFFGLITIITLSLLGAYLIGLAINAGRDAAQLKTQKWNRDRSQANYAKAREIAARRKGAEKFMADLGAWHETGREWNRVLSALAMATPKTIQLVELRMQSEIKSPPPTAPQSNQKEGETAEKSPCVTTELRLSGRTSSPTADGEVANLRDAFKRPPLSNGLLEASIPPGAFRQDPRPQANTADRIFEILCTYEEIPLSGDNLPTKKER